VGINSVGQPSLQEEIPKRKLVGDVFTEKVTSIVDGISPVPGGVGPLTVLSLFENLADAYEKQV
jgi:methylenetetrahydrofolate dehydrogenase (NADP+)/methenyltetrahydrofolate cyclohydrolase